MQLHQVLVQDWMTTTPITTRADMPLISAYELMQRHNVRRLPVVDTEAKLCGIVTRSDILQVIPFSQEETARVDALFALAGLTVGEIMTRTPVTVTPDQGIQEAAGRMIRGKVSGLPVVVDEHVVGMITESDIFRLVVDSWQQP